ncbi:hypothetical protein [Demequina sp. NBRC 110051]|uniref:hypothetical protein n=1 Tax=Demequina sp. NBRC 110051 TaxID=1570340 RepID=UPI00117E3166|nr:hypothetical protein [Demequina sp. NBRC 110051]
MRESGVRDLVSRQFRGSGGTSEVRASVHGAMSRVAADAARAGGALLAMDLTLIDGVPTPSTLVVFRPTVPSTAAEVADGLRGTPDVEVAEGATGPIVRWVTVQSSPEFDGVQAVEQLKAEYWLDPGDGHGLYHAVFTSPLVSLRDALVDLYDVMVSSVSTAPEEPGIVRARPAAST